MNYNDEELQKELKKLKSSHSLNPQSKESMKTVIQKHAKKKRTRSKLKRSAIWFSTAAALMIGAGLLFNTLNSTQSVMPFEDHNQTEYNDTSEESKEIPAKSGEDEGTEESTAPTSDPDASQSLTVNEEGTEPGTIMLEGMEEETTFTNYTLEPYGIKYQLTELFSSYDVNNQSVTHYNDTNSVSMKFEVVEDANLDDVVSEVQSEYSDVASETGAPAETPPGEENPFRGFGQHFSQSPQGYYIYQIDENVLVIQYEYPLEAADGMGPRLLALRESLTH